MVKKPQWLGDVAACDARLAYTLLQSGMAPGGYVDTGGWELINLVGRWESGTANQTVQGEQLGIIEADLWIRRVKYTVRRPLAFPGSIFKSQADYFNMLNPNIDFTFIVNSFCRYVISPKPTPLENIREVFEASAPAGMVLRCSADVLVEYTNNRALAADEIPTEAIITLSGTRLPPGIYGGCTEVQAREVLKELGLLPE